MFGFLTLSGCRYVAMATMPMVSIDALKPAGTRRACVGGVKDRQSGELISRLRAVSCSASVGCCVVIR
jgi:hypothetical protein